MFVRVNKRDDVAVMPSATSAADRQTYGRETVVERSRLSNDGGPRRALRSLLIIQRRRRPTERVRASTHRPDDRLGLTLTSCGAEERLIIPAIRFGPPPALLAPRNEF